MDTTTATYLNRSFHLVLWKDNVEVIVRRYDRHGLLHVEDRLAARHGHRAHLLAAGQGDMRMHCVDTFILLFGISYDAYIIVHTWYMQNM